MLIASRALRGPLRRLEESVRPPVTLSCQRTAVRSAAGPHLPGCETRRGSWQACARGPSVRETHRVAADNTVLCPSICELRASTSLSPDVWLKFLPCRRKCRANFMGLRALHPTSPQGPPKGPARCGRALQSACQGLAGHRANAEPSHRSVGISRKLGL